MGNKKHLSTKPRSSENVQSQFVIAGMQRPGGASPHGAPHHIRCTERARVSQLRSNIAIYHKWYVAQVVVAMQVSVHAPAFTA